MIALQTPVKSIVVGLCLVMAAFLGWYLQPKELVADHQPSIDLNATVPASFGDWVEDKTVIPLPPSPEVAQQLKDIYAQLLERSYINSKGQRVMLSIAYGDRQKDGLRVHFPEVCYQAQGFTVHNQETSTVTLDGKKLSVVQLVTQKGGRHEPVMYWVTVGDGLTTTSAFQHKLASLVYGITGQVPDGMLVRVSTIDRNPENAFHIQQQFLEDMLHALDPSVRKRFFGQEF